MLCVISFYNSKPNIFCKIKNFKVYDLEINKDENICKKVQQTGD